MNPFQTRRSRSGQGTAGTVDMTHGPLLGKILLFSLPLMASNLLQLLFNTADVVVVGRWAGHASLAAVGSTSCVINLVINLLVGVSVGVNVVVARYLGETGRETEISNALHTALLLGLAGGALLGAAGSLTAGWMLDLIAAPADVRPLALIYLRIYFAGTPFTMVYNYGAAAPVGGGGPGGSGLPGTGGSRAGHLHRRPGAGRGSAHQL